jgi:peroxiredoxin Q/BCP
VQGNGFRDESVQIVGVSVDSVDDNAAFAAKFGYDFPLLSDCDRAISLAYGACGSAADRFARRITYLIDEQGRITHALDKVHPTTHTATVLDLLG